MRELIYIADPMCSWCWGFSPVIRQLTALAEGRAGFRIVMGGLRSDSQPMSEERRRAIAGHWVKVEAVTGQPFKYGLLESATFVYDTEPACRAVVTVRSIEGDLAALKMFDRLQSAFYADNVDITEAENAAAIAAAAGVDSIEFSRLFASPELAVRTRTDFVRSRDMGISGFPSVIVRENGRAALLTRGYQPFADIGEAFENWLSGQSRLNE